VNEINVVIQPLNEINIVIQPLIARIPIEVSMTKPAASVTTANVKEALDITTLSGSNTGDQILPTIANNLTETVTGKALDATQGKVLQDNKVDKAGDSITGSLAIGGYLETPNTWGMKWKFASNADTVEMNSSETAWKFNVAAGGVTKYRFSSSKAGSILGPIVDFNVSGSSIFYGNVGIGKTTPSEKLDILGNIAVSGTVDGVDILAEKNRLANTLGTNTGDQDLSGLMPKSGGTFTGTAIGNNNTSYTTSQLRNARIYADGATVPTLADGELAFVYEV